MADGEAAERARRPEDLDRLFLERANVGDVDGVTSLPVFQIEISRSRPSITKDSRSPTAPVRSSTISSGWCRARPLTGVTDSRVTRAHTLTPAPSSPC
jgi:hypothetical protein